MLPTGSARSVDRPAPPTCQTRVPVAAPLTLAVTLEQCWHRVPGGTARAALEILEALPAADPSIEAIGVSARHGSPPASPWRPPVPVVQLPLPRLALYESWHRAGWPAVERATGPVDVVWASGYAVPPARAPVVLTLHDLAWRRDPNHFTRRGRSFFEAALAVARRRVEVVVCSSEATRADAAAAGIDPSRLRVVPLGVEPVDVPADAVAEVRRRFGLEAPYVLWVGTVEPRKNLERLLDAFERVAAGRELTLALVGPAGWGSSLDERIAAAGAAVRPLGFVSEDDKAALYTGAAAFCYPSLWEGFGLPVLEAMAQGAAVVTSAGGATAEAAGDAAVLVDPTDPEAIAEGLRAVLDDVERAQSMVAAGRRRAAAFPWSATATAMSKLFHEVGS